MIITQTPISLSLLGVGTDNKDWAEKHGGLVIGGAINSYVYSFANRSLFGYCASRSGIPLIEQMVKRVGFNYDVSLTTHADVVMENQAMVVGAKNSLYCLKGRHLTPDDLFGAGIHEEPVEPHKTAMAAHGGLRAVNFEKSGDVMPLPFLLSGDQVASLESHLMLFVKNAPHYWMKTSELSDHGRFASQQLAEKGFEAIERRDWCELGRLMDMTYQLQGEANIEPSQWYAKARVAGAWGGRRDEYFLILVVPPEKQGAVAAVLSGEALLRVPFKFSERGSTLIFADRRGVNVD